MAIYHLSVKTVSRATGRSAVAAAAYRTATVLKNERDGLVHDYSRRSGVETAFIVAPEIVAWADDRSVLWNAAEAAEKRKDAKVAREYELALPCELDRGGREALVRAFAGEVVARFGVVADVAIHLPGREGDQRNHHAHVLTTTRAVTADGMGAKTRDLDVKQTSGPAVEALRELWAVQVNHALQRIQEASRVDHRSYARQGHNQVPEVHLGPGASGLERRAERERQAEPEAKRRPAEAVTERGQQNAAVREQNRVIEIARKALEVARDAVKQLEHHAAVGVQKVRGLLRGVGAMVRSDREQATRQEREREHQAVELRQRQEQDRQRVEAEKLAEVQRQTVTQAERDAAWLRGPAKDPSEAREATHRETTRQPSRGPSL